MKCWNIYSPYKFNITVTDSPIAQLPDVSVATSSSITRSGAESNIADDESVVDGEKMFNTSRIFN